jgi:hypothetical protein
MRKTILLIAFTLTLLGSVAVHADPPAPVCPPFCVEVSNLR